MADVTIFIAFLAGLISFLSPCVLPLVPAFLAYVSGVSVDEVEKKKKGVKTTIFINTIIFVLGFSIVFALFGALLNSVFEHIGYAVRIWAGRVGGTMIILFGLYLLGIVKMPWLARDHQISVKKFRYSYVTSFLFGAAFAVGWTPCVGAVLGSVLTLAATQPEMAFGLLMAYALGLGIPFLVAGAFISRSSDLIARMSRSKVFSYFNYAMGTILILLGILVFTDNLSAVANYASVFFLLGDMA